MRQLRQSLPTGKDDVLRFHQASVALLPTLPTTSSASARTIAERERLLAIRFPESLREWYVMDRSVELLGEYSNDDWPVPLGQLGSPVEDWYGDGPRNLIDDGLLWFMAENQGVCNWAVRLDGTDDPPVLVEVDSARRDIWQPAAATFSEFVYCQIWDHPRGTLLCEAQERSLSKDDLRYLQRQFCPGPVTESWPGSRNLRFAAPHGRILIWTTEEDQTDWLLYANSEQRMNRLIRSVWACGSLSTTLYGTDAGAESALREVRTTVG